MTKGLQKNGLSVPRKSAGCEIISLSCGDNYCPQTAKRKIGFRVFNIFDVVKDQQPSDAKLTGGFDWKSVR